MARFDLAAIRAGLAEALEAATDLARVYPYLPETISPTELPAAYVGLPQPTEYRARFGAGATTTTLAVTVIAGRVDVADSQAELDRILSQLPPTGGSDDDPYVGVVDAVLADETLGGTCSTSTVERADNARVVTVGEVEFLAVDLTVRIHT